jgi:hypothetical protein
MSSCFAWQKHRAESSVEAETQRVAEYTLCCAPDGLSNCNDGLRCSAHRQESHEGKPNRSAYRGYYKFDTFLD